MKRELDYVLANMIEVVFVVVHLVESMCVGEIQQRRNSTFFAVASNKAVVAVKYYYGCYKCIVHGYMNDILLIIHFTVIRCASFGSVYGILLFKCIDLFTVLLES